MGPGETTEAPRPAPERAEQGHVEEPIEYRDGHRSGLGDS